jgi:hypothetical protein
LNCARDYPSLKLFIASILVSLFFAGFWRGADVFAQDRTISEPPASGWQFVPAYGARFGIEAMKDSMPRSRFEAFYDVPIGDVLFTPEAHISGFENLAFGIAPQVKMGLSKSSRVTPFISLGFDFTVWPNDVTMGPILTASLATTVVEPVQLELTGEVHPLWYLGTGHRAILFGILAGIRIPVPNETN